MILTFSPKTGFTNSLSTTQRLKTVTLPFERGIHENGNANIVTSIYRIVSMNWLPSSIHSLFLLCFCLLCKDHGVQTHAPHLYTHNLEIFPMSPFRFSLSIIFILGGFYLGPFLAPHVIPHAKLCISNCPNTNTENTRCWNFDFLKPKLYQIDIWIYTYIHIHIYR